MNLHHKVDVFQSAIAEQRPFEGELLQQIKDFYRVGLTYTSNALEGNSLTESETKVLIEDGITVGGKPLRDTLEAVDHAKAYDFMFTLIGNRKITEEHILQLHRLFYGNIEPEFAGCYRNIPVFISGSKYPVAKAGEIPAQIAGLIAWADENRELLHPVSFAAELHRKFVFIHPFKDGNGRVARLLMNTALIQDGFLPVIIPPILRHEYISLLEQAHCEEQPFTDFIVQQEIESQKDFMRMMHLPLLEQGMKME